jgi:hypothetical protein
MSSFSAMKGLASWNPQLLLEDASLEVKAFKSTVKGIEFFVATHLFLGLLGFVAFCTKFSHCVDMLIAEKKQKAFLYEGKQVLILLGFCNQIFGITQLWRVQERRLLLFLFGGPDADFTEEEMCRQDAFLAEITRAVCREMFKNDAHGFKLHFKRFIAMLSFTHLDVQAFVLEEVAPMVVARQSVLSAASLDSGHVEMPQHWTGSAGSV